jgi:hypothetical protein
MSIYPEDDDLYFDDLPEDFEEEERAGLSLTAKLLILIMVLALLATLVWPLFHYGRQRYHFNLPTPTPSIYLEARQFAAKESP